jgi:DNA-binding NarL/FixJ family response regulator
MILSVYLESVKVTRQKDDALPSLTSREREVIQILAEGMSTKDAARHLNLSTKTAETHRSNIMRKLKLHSVSELVLFAVRNGIIQVATDAIESDSRSVRP